MWYGMGALQTQLLLSASIVRVLAQVGWFEYSETAHPNWAAEHWKTISLVCYSYKHSFLNMGSSDGERSMGTKHTPLIVFYI